MKKGQALYESHCALCHKLDGKGMPPAFPALKGSIVATGPEQHHISVVLNGRPGTAMQAFNDQLTDEEIAEIVTYERNSWGNDNTSLYGPQAGGLIQPDEVTAERNK